MNYYLTLAIILFGYCNFWFVISLIKKRNDVADVAWGLGFVVLAWASFLLTDQPTLQGGIVNMLVTLWGTRLAWHIGSRHRGKPEDSRYHAWRTEWGKWFFIRSYAQVFFLQGFLMYLIALPILIINQHPAVTLTIWDGIGVAVFGFGFLFEMVSDAQLARFIRNPQNKGKLMQSGLWRYSRHPNYFGEVTLWWGIWLIALGVTNGFFGIVGPLTITVLILFVSGIPLLEKKYAGRTDFEIYKKQTSIFLPLPPKRI